MLGKLLGMEYRKKEGFASDLYNYLQARQPQAIRNAEVILSEISAGNPAAGVFNYGSSFSFRIEQVLVK